MANCDRVPVRNNKENVPPRGKYLIGKKKNKQEILPTKKIKKIIFNKSLIDLTQDTYDENEGGSFQELEKILPAPCDTNNNPEEPKPQNVEPNRNNSFELMMNSILYPKSYAANKTILSQNPQDATLNLNDNERKETTTLSHSFEIMLNSLLYPQKPAPSGSKPDPAIQRPHDLSFNELMNNILTPDLNAPKRPNNATGDVASQKSQKKTNFQPNRIVTSWEMENSAKLLVPPIFATESSYQNSDKSDFQSSKALDSNLGSPIMPWLLPPDWKADYLKDRPCNNLPNEASAKLSTSQNNEDMIRSEPSASLESKNSNTHDTHITGLISRIFATESCPQNSEKTDFENSKTLEAKEEASSPIMPWSLPPDWGTNDSKDQICNDLPGAPGFEQPPTFLSDGDVLPSHPENLGHCPKEERDRLLVCNQESFMVSSDDHNWIYSDQPFSPILNTYFDPQEAIKQMFDCGQQQSVTKEMSTQTSFDLSSSQNMTSFHCELLPPVRFLDTYPEPIQVDVNCCPGSSKKRNKSKKGPRKLPQRQPKLYTNTQRCTSKNSPRDGSVGEITGRVPHILSMLADDATLLPDGRKIYNVIKIGTAKWLESALILHDRQYVSSFKKDKSAKNEVFEAANTASLYVDYATKVSLERSSKGNMKIFKILKTGSECSQSSHIEDVDDNLSISQGRKLTRYQVNLGLAIDQICATEALIRSDYEIEIIDKAKIRLKIHSIISQLFEVFEDGHIPILRLKRPTKSNCVFENDRLQLNMSSGRICSPAIFCRLLYLLGKIYSLLQNDTKLTKREIFYQVKNCVKTQKMLDEAAANASFLLGIGLWHLNIVANSDLVYGNLKLLWKSGEMTNCNNLAALIPNDLDDLAEVRSNASFILVVEKESIFHKLLEEDLPNKLARPFILITGKGVPNFNTRLFLNRLSRMMAVPVFILVDPDAYGISIMLTYRFGCIKSCHLNNELAVPNARWLGVFPSEISKYGMPFQHLIKRDRSLITAKLKLSYVDKYPRIREEMETMLRTDKKGSIEGLIKSETFLSEAYLPMKFYNKDFV